MRNYPCIFLDVRTNQCIPLPLNFTKIYAQGVPAVSADFLEINTTMYLVNYERIAREFVKNYTYEAAIAHSQKWHDYYYLNLSFLQQVLTINFVKRGFSGIVNDLILKAPMTINNAEPQWTLGAVMEYCSPNVNYNKSNKGFWRKGLIILLVVAITIVLVVSVVLFIRSRRTAYSESLTAQVLKESV